MALRTLPLLLLFASSALAQTTGTATIVGAVTDSTGSVVAGAKITVVNVNTSFVHNSVTTPEGTYYIPNLNPGTYQLTIEATGFRTHVRDGIILRTAEQPRLDVQLEVGTMAESVQVTAAAPLLETETAAAGQVLEGWDPDGRRIAFISRRSGKLELWIINRDGSGLEQITHTQNRGSVMYPQWSPDGSRLGYYVSDEGSYLLDAGKPWKEQTPQALPAMSNESFAAYAWSPDGRKIAGLHSPRTRCLVGPHHLFSRISRIRKGHRIRTRPGLAERQPQASLPTQSGYDQPDRQPDQKGAPGLLRCTGNYPRKVRSLSR